MKEGGSHDTRRSWLMPVTSFTSAEERRCQQPSNPFASAGDRRRHWPGGFRACEYAVLEAKHAWWRSDHQSVQSALVPRPSNRENYVVGVEHGSQLAFPSPAFGTSTLEANKGPPNTLAPTSTSMSLFSDNVAR